MGIYRLLFGVRSRRTEPSWETQEDASGAILSTSTALLPSTILPSAGPPKRRFVIERSPKCPSHDIAGVDEYPWYVQEVTHGDDSDDYGRMDSHPAALALVGQMLKGQRYAAD